MGCGNSTNATARISPGDIVMKFIDSGEPASKEEISVIENFFNLADEDQNGTISDDEVGVLLSKFIQSGVDRSAVLHVSMCLRGEWGTIDDDGEEGGKKKSSSSGTRAVVDKDFSVPASSRNPIELDTVVKWWPSILDYVTRYQSACLQSYTPKYEFSFDTLIQPFRDDGVGKLLLGDIPKLIDRVTAECYAGECIFSDSRFPANEAALGKRDGTVQWKRPRDLFPSTTATSPHPMLYKDGASPTDVICRNFGVNFFSAAMTSLGQRFDLLVSAIYPPYYNPAGIYGVRLLLEESWVWVIVDDAVPVKERRHLSSHTKKTGGGGDFEPLFMMSAVEGEMWPLVIDKAFAKLKGSYIALHRNRSLLLDPLTLIAGCSPSIYTVAGISPADRADEMWRVTTFYMDKQWFLTASPTVEDPSSGLVVEHAYSILGYISQGHNVRLCKCRNPWGSGEWKGKWGDGDTASWDAYPDLKKRCKFEAKEDGIFWMSIEDIAERFRSFHCHAVRPDVDRSSAEHSLLLHASMDRSKNNNITSDVDDDDEPKVILGANVQLTTVVAAPADGTNNPLSDFGSRSSSTAGGHPPLRDRPSAVTMVGTDNINASEASIRSNDSSGRHSSHILSHVSSRTYGDLTRVSKMSSFDHMQWYTFKQCWQECYAQLDTLEKTYIKYPVYETHSSVFEGLPEQIKEQGVDAVSGTIATNTNTTTTAATAVPAFMSPFDCPQYKLEVPAGETCEFLFRSIRKFDTDGDGIDDDEDSDFDPIDLITASNSPAAGSCPLPYTYLVRGDERIHTIPTKTLAEAFGGYAHTELKPGSYILFVIAYQRGDVPVKLVTKSQKKLNITRLPTQKGVIAIRGGALPAIGNHLERLLKEKKDGRDEKEVVDRVGDAFHMRVLCKPSSFAMKVVHFALLVDHKFNYLTGSGSIGLGSCRDALSGSHFKWSNFRDQCLSTTTVCSLTTMGAGPPFYLYPFFSGPPRAEGPIPYTIVAWGDTHGLEGSLTLTQEDTHAAAHHKKS